MKKLRNILLAGIAALGALACTELEHVMFNPTNATAPVLNKLNVNESTLTEDGTFGTLVFTPADYGFTGGVKYQAFADLNSDFAAEKSVTAATELSGLASNEDGTLSMSIKSSDLNNILISKGVASGTETTVYFRIKSTLQGESGAVGGAGAVLVSEALNAKVIPYEAEKEYAKVWLPGSANGWNHGKAEHLFCFAEDDDTFEGVTFFGDDPSANQFKITGADNWDKATGNWGVADASAPAESATLQLLNDSQDNITQYTAHKYYHFSFKKSSLVLTMDYGFDQVGLIGLNGDWDNDVVMLWDKYKQRFYADVDIAAATAFKFRLDADWGMNWGGELAALSAGGGDIPIEAGKYRIYLNLGQASKVTGAASAEDYGKSIEPDQPVEPATPPSGYGLVGDMNSWGDNGEGGWSDIMMSEASGVYTGYLTMSADAQKFKIRKDGDWTESWGIAEGGSLTLGTAFDAVSGGSDIIVPLAGFYKVVFDSNNSKITVFGGDDAVVWSVIGGFNGWAGDVDMTLTDGKWISGSFATTEENQEIKIRKNHDWTESVGGTMTELGVAFAAVSENGPNIVIPAVGEYIVTYDPTAATILVENALPSKCWSVTGDFNSWKDEYMTKTGTGLWISNPVELTGGFKLRFDNGWAVNRGGVFSAAGVPFAVSQDGSNITVPDGKYQIVYNPYLETITVNPATEWSVIGAFEGHNWDWDLYLSKMEDGTYHSEPFIANGEIKIRFAGDWGDNRGLDGSVEVADGTPLPVKKDGDNLKVPVVDQAYVLVYDPAAEQITLTVAWAITGKIEESDWGTDFFLTETSKGIWETAVVINGEFKIRKSGNWDINRGAAGDSPVTLTDATALEGIVNGGQNFAVASPGTKYRITYDANAEKITANPLI